MSTMTTKDISDKQVAFIEILAERIDDDAKVFDLLTDQFSVVSARDLDRRQASAFIDTLKGYADEARQAKVQQRAEKRVMQEAVAAATGLDVGMYQRDGVVIKVYPARNGGHLLAKRMNEDGEFVYMGAASRFVSVEHKMTLAQAKEFGDAFGVCCCCGRLLTKEESVADGIGPVCKRKNFGAGE